MKLKNSLRAVAVAAAMATASMAASAAYVVLDGWQLDTPIISVTDIGRLNLVSGTATVEQETVGGVVVAGADFKESGAIFSLSYTAEDTVGAGDTGAPTLLGETLTLSFTDVLGHVTSVLGDGSFEFAFDSGSFLLEGSAGADYASGSIIGLGGTLGSTVVIGGINGESTVLAAIGAILNAAFDIKDSGGNSLQADLLAGNVLFEAVTNNNVTSSLATGACSFDAAAQCTTFSIASAGDAYLVQAVPEPGSIALLGLGLLGLGALRRRASSK